MASCDLLTQHDVPVLALPLTIDNDINGTDETIGFDTAVTTIAEALDKLHTTAEAHHRVMVVETMGGATGWLALYGGIAGGADFIVIPEVTVEKDKIVNHIYRRRESGRGFSIVVIAEGANCHGFPTLKWRWTRFSAGNTRCHRHGNTYNRSWTSAKRRQPNCAGSTTSYTNGHGTS